MVLRMMSSRHYPISISAECRLIPANIGGQAEAKVKLICPDQGRNPRTGCDPRHHQGGQRQRKQVMPNVDLSEGAMLAEFGRTGIKVLGCENQWLPVEDFLGAGGGAGFKGSCLNE